MTTNGPNGDGSKSLTRESKFGQFANGAAVVLALSIASGLGEVDFTPLPDFLEPILIGGAGALAGLLVAWATKNRPTSLAGTFRTDRS